MADNRGKTMPAEFDATPTLEELATRQGVVPVQEFESLLGPPNPGDEESAEEFLAQLRQWRREGIRPPME